MGLTYRDKEPYMLLRSVKNNQMDVVGLWEEALGENPHWPGKSSKLHKEKPPGGFKPGSCRK